MEIGKVKEAILKRSILRAITYKRPEVLESAAIGRDASLLQFADNEVTVISTNPVTYMFYGMEKLGIASAVNNVAARGAEPVAVEVCILLPLRYKESALKRIMQNINDVCRTMQVQLCGGHTELTPAVITPVITVTAAGKMSWGTEEKRRTPVSGMDIVLSKYIGIGGTVMMLKKKREELEKRFQKSFLAGLDDFEKWYPVVQEAETAIKCGTFMMHDISRGGIMNALWELAEEADAGLEIELEKVPIRQETIELCEFFHLNPYEMFSTGALLMVAENGAHLVKSLEEKGIPAAVIGKMTDGRERIFWRNEEKAFITPPKGDEIYKIF